MFEAIGNLITIVIWVVAIFLFGGGIILCVGNFTSGKGGAIFQGVIAVILGVVTFLGVYSWLESVVWCLLLSGLVIGLVSTAGSDRLQDAPKKEKKYGVTDALIDAYVEEKVIEEAVENAIRKSRE